MANTGQPIKPPAFGHDEDEVAFDKKIDGSRMKRRLIVGIGCVAAAAIVLSRLIAKPAPEPLAAFVSPDGRSVPSFLKSIDDADHVSNWRAGLDVTRDFSSYCNEMPISSIISLFSRGSQESQLSHKDGKFFYAYSFRSGDMNRLVSHLTHFPFSPDPLELWITIVVSGSDAKFTEAKIVDKTAYL